ncbi:hypothetical protein KG088_17850 [Halomonas sp. TRM85114]|uniref:hypothetical protein n=1 Tax=Halomonas jincaotanensis TaxID=2810616 RepID=UPI001BD689E2|nr:hypothetical protein [Halomonas jincaotanensis]MBS9405471.1 hypothetical protein [Halomonas jincaotanensis]
MASHEHEHEDEHRDEEELWAMNSIQAFFDYYADLDYGDVRRNVSKVIRGRKKRDPIAYKMLGREFLQTVERGNPKTVDAYLEAGMPINYQDPVTKQSALHVAAAARAREAIRVLAKYPDCNYILRDRHGRLPSELAYVFGGDTALSRYLTIKEFKQAKSERCILKYRETLPLK